MSARRIVVLYGAVAEAASPDERDVLDQLQAVTAALERLGYVPEPLALTLDLEAARQRLAQERLLCVFNLVESLEGSGRLIHLAPALLEELRLPYTGTPLTGMFLSSNKLVAKRLLAAAGLPTPPWRQADGLDDGCPGPWLIKSVWEHASIGLDDSSLVRDAAALSVSLRERCHGGGDWFAEAYVDGREFNLALIAGSKGLEVLPPAEIRFADFPSGKPKIVGYAAKWHEGSFEYHHTQRSFSFTQADLPLLERLKELALRCVALLQVRGYARVDFRVDGEGEPWILEVNANPCLSPDAGFSAAAQQAGLGVDAVVERIVQDCLRGKSVQTLLSELPAANAKVLHSPSTGRWLGQLAFRSEVRSTDRDHVCRLAVASGFFSAAEVQVAVELVEERLLQGTASGYEFVFAEQGDEMLGYTCFGPIPCTRMSYDLYWIVVDPACQGRGIGKALLERSEALIGSQGGQRIYIETSARAQYAGTRAFYRRCGYRQVALLDDFYAPGDGKCVYCKVLESPAVSQR